ncbi:MAG TPA: hypothetical protein VK906_10075 [Egicoccus sp.]|nr:hypothetical protein [Egicoccus sp.]HSK23514.1 hypothetical protein [Egicoccus sp.]
MNLAVALLVAAVVVPLLARLAGNVAAVWIAALLLAVGAGLDAAGVAVLTGLAGPLERTPVLAPAGPGAVTRALLVGVLAWCGPAADVLVRRVLARTGLPGPEAAATAGLRAGRWIGRLERWVLLLCVAAGQPALAVIPIGGKALFRYAEVLADARAERPRLLAAGEDPATAPPRDALVDYVIVGSLASWAQAIALGLLVAAS